VRRRHILIVAALLAVATGVTGWVLQTRTTSLADCRPGDVACVEEKVLAGDPSVAGVLDRLDEMAAFDEEGLGSFCRSRGVLLGRQLFTDVSDVIAVVESGMSSPCSRPVLDGMVSVWAERGVASDGIDRLVGSCVLLGGAEAYEVCGRTVAAATAGMWNPDALRRCTGLGVEARRVCFAALFHRFTATDGREDRMDALTTLCAYWPLNLFQDECFAMVADPVFTEAVLTLSVSDDELAAEDAALLRTLFDFCLRMGPGAAECQRVGFDVVNTFGRAGAVGSVRRAAICALVVEGAESHCRTEPPRAVGEPVDPVG
jgi:hypothetical protein